MGAGDFAAEVAGLDSAGAADLDAACEGLRSSRRVAAAWGVAGCVARRQGASVRSFSIKGRVRRAVLIMRVRALARAAEMPFMARSS